MERVEGVRRVFLFPLFREVLKSAWLHRAVCGAPGGTSKQVRCPLPPSAPPFPLTARAAGGCARRKSK